MKNELFKSILKKYLKDKSIQQAIIFGSYANNTATRRSDLDLIIIKNTEKSFFDRYREFNDLFLTFPVAVDLLIYTPEEWGKMKQKPFFKKINSEGIVVYESKQK